MPIDLTSLMFAMMLGKNGSSGSGSIEGLPELKNPASSGDVAYSKQYINGSGAVKTGTLAEREHSDISISIPEGDSEDAVAKVSVKRGIYRNTSNEIFYVNIPTEDIEITPGSEDIVLYNSEGVLIRMVKVLGDDLSDVLGDISGESNRAKIEALLGIANEVIVDDADDLYDAIEELVYGYYRGTTPNLIESKTIEANGTYDASDENADGYKSVEVNVPEPNLSDVLGDNSGKSNREKIVNAIGSANSVTGESDETLTGAIGSLSEGYVSADMIGEATGTTSQEKVEYLIGVANETIDGTDVSTLADAVDTLIDGYGQGGGTSYVSDVLPVYHAIVTLDEDYTSTSDVGNFPMSDTQVAELKAFLQNHLFGYTRTFQIIVAAQNDVVPAAARFIRGDLYGISSGAIAAIGNALTNANFAKYTNVDGATSVSKSWNPSNYGIRVTFNNNASTIYHDMRCDGSNVVSIGAGTYDIWCIVIDDLSRLSGSGDSSGDEMSPGDALNILTGGVM